MAGQSIREIGRDELQDNGLPWRRQISAVHGNFLRVYTGMKPKLIIGNKNYSSWSLRAWFLLREADIDFDEHRIPLDTDETAQQIAEFSPAGRVPALLLEDVTVWDSLAIAETVAERWPEKKLWPVDATARAHARSISAEMHAGFEVLRSRMPMNCRAMGRRVGQDARRL